MKKIVGRTGVFIGTCILLYAFMCYFPTQQLDEHFMEKQKCPACYGQSLCHDIATKDGFVLNTIKWNFFKLMDVRNVHVGLINSIPVVFKKLGHNWELDKFDSTICQTDSRLQNLDTRPCHPGLALQRVLHHYNRSLSSLLKYEPQLFEGSDAAQCGEESLALQELLRRYKEQDRSDDALEHFVTMLAINPEPLILMAFGGGSLPLPRLLGACGRVVAVQYAGHTLTHAALESPWRTRAHYTLQLLQLARQLSEEPIRLYLTDPSPDNFAVDDDQRLWLVDAENVVLVDRRTPGLVDEVHVNDGLGCKDCLSFDMAELCSHSVADHNYFVICKSLLSSTPFESSIPGGLLSQLPPNAPSLLRTLVELCSYPADMAMGRWTRERLTYEDTYDGSKKFQFWHDEAQPHGREEADTVTKHGDDYGGEKGPGGDEVLLNVTSRRQAARLLEEQLLVLLQTTGEQDMEPSKEL